MLVALGRVSKKTRGVLLNLPIETGIYPLFLI